MRFGLKERMLMEIGVFPPNMNSDGGHGSGNFEHEGRPGKIGGSAPSDNPKSESAKANRKEFLTNAMEKFSDGEGLQVKDSEFPEYTAEIRKNEEYGYYTNSLTGELVTVDDIFNSGRYSDIKTLKEVHDEETKFEPKFKTKEEYQAAKKKVMDSFGSALSEIDSIYQNGLKEINDKYGNRYELRNEVLSDSSLSDEEKESKLQEIDSRMKEKNQEIVDLEMDIEDMKDGYTSEFDKIYEPEYEYRHISSDHDIDDDCKKEVINPAGLEENCQRCAVAFELRQRGYDVQASDGEGGALASGMSINYCFKKSENYIPPQEKYGGINVYDIHQKMNEWGDYSRAIIGVSSRKLGLGHAFNICKIGDEVFAVDAQRGVKKPLSEYFGSDIPFGADIDYAYVIRTDNAQLDCLTDSYVKERTEEK